MIDAHTTLIVDYEVLSKSCQTCAIQRTKLLKKKISQVKYDRFKQEHDRVCSLNYEGSSGGMEEKAAIIMWQRSLDKNLRYLIYIGDGDCSAYNAVCKLNDDKGPYGEEKQVIKEECVNHVHKRMGTALRKLVKETTAEQKTKTGEQRKKKLLAGRGKLTDNVIEKLTDYYGNAIRRNVGKTVNEMRNDIMSTYFHCSSSDAKPMHFLCPKGTESWCFWQRGKALQQDEEDKQKKAGEEAAATMSAAHVSFYGKKAPKLKLTPIPSHDTMKIRFSVEKELALKIKAVYNRLTEDSLLRRCLQGKTQNPNESIHSRIWTLCPKIKSLGKVTLDFAVAQSVLNYNIGYKTAYLGKELGIINASVLQWLEMRDIERERVRPSKPRKKRKQQDPEPQYSSGAF